MQDYSNAFPGTALEIAFRLSCSVSLVARAAFKKSLIYNLGNSFHLTCFLLPAATVTDNDFSSIMQLYAESLFNAHTYKGFVIFHLDKAKKVYIVYIRYSTMEYILP